MGHTLGEMETNDEHRDRVIYGPMAEELREYDKRVKQGIVHTDQYAAIMEEHRETLRRERPSWGV